MKWKTSVEFECENCDILEVAVVRLEVVEDGVGSLLVEPVTGPKGWKYSHRHLGFVCNTCLEAKND